MTKKTVKELDGALTLLKTEFVDLRNKYEDLNEKYERLEAKYNVSNPKCDICDGSIFN